jgi:DNA-nicking Smr family endonuclease
MTEDDENAFRRAMHDVRPLASGGPPGRKTPPANALLARARRARALRAAEDTLAGLPTRIAEAAREGAALRYRRADLGPSAWARLRRGRIPIEAEVDLHGLDRQAARRMLHEFLQESIDLEHRCVRVICGKGRSSGPEGPVLRGLVDDWLREIPEVAGFADAKPGHGGSGALYVLLAPPRRKVR